MEIVAKSGKAIIYFTSDLAFNLPGFTIEYEHNKCLYSCSNHGKCLKNGNCKCDLSYKGEFCEQQVCLANMDGETGPCKQEATCKNEKCDCHKHTHGK